LGLDIHKFFIPHITLARGKHIPRIQQNINLAFIAKSINIVESKLYRTGPEYSIIKTIPLL
jgi:2'-5' RNA ligase